MIQKTFYFLCCALMSLSMGFSPLAWAADPAPAKPAAKGKEPPKAVERPTRTFGEEPMFYFDADRRPFTFPIETAMDAVPNFFVDNLVHVREELKHIS